MKPNVSKSDYYQKDKKFNYYKWYSEGFEVQLGKIDSEMMHFYFTYFDSTYNIDVTDWDAGELITYEFNGKGTVHENGTITLHGESPFKNNEYKIVMRGGLGEIYAKFELNSEFKRKFPHPKKKRYAYCESRSYVVQDCYEN